MVRSKRPCAPPLSRGALETGLALACDFFAPAGLLALSTCSQAMEKLASADRNWKAHTMRFYPGATHLRTFCALTGRREYARLHRIVKAKRPAPPSIETYSALVVVEHRGDTVVEGLFDMTLEDDSVFIEVDAIASAGLKKFGRALASYLLLVSPSFSVCLVRKSDGKCLQLLTDAEVAAFSPVEGETIYQVSDKTPGLWLEWSFVFEERDESQDFEREPGSREGQFLTGTRLKLVYPEGPGSDIAVGPPTILELWGLDPSWI